MPIQSHELEIFGIKLWFAKAAQKSYRHRQQVIRTSSTGNMLGYFCSPMIQGLRLQDMVTAHRQLQWDSKDATVAERQKNYHCI